jgi:ATP adenylyltransferase
VTLEHLWAGWRSEYVSSVPTHGQGGPAAGAADSCVFCRIAASGAPAADTGVLWRGELTVAVLNAYPYASGHLMVMPVRHVSGLEELDGAEATELWQALRDGVAALTAGYGPEGINIGANLGRAAGAGIPAHLHLHAVPRWVGDTNFMTAVAGTRVLPESMAASWERLAPVWPR